jgi:hypothetical protein
MTTLKEFYIADRDMWLNNTKEKHCWIFKTITDTRNRNNGVTHTLPTLFNFNEGGIVFIEHWTRKQVFNYISIRGLRNCLVSFKYYISAKCFVWKFKTSRILRRVNWQILTDVYFQLKQSDCLMKARRPLERKQRNIPDSEFQQKPVQNLKHRTLCL